MKTWPLWAMMVAACASGPNLTSREILDRSAEAERVEVRQVLIAWEDCARAHKGKLDAKAARRTREEADALVTSLLGRLRQGAPIEPLMAEHSSDPGSSTSHESYDVTADSPYVLGFVRLALRLRRGETGVVKSEYGWHILKRIK